MRAVIDCACLRHNVAVVKKFAPGIDIIGVVKADAYGHGSIRVTRELLTAGIDQFAVATLAEAIVLRDAGISEPILVFAPPEKATVDVYQTYGLGAVVTGPEDVRVLSRLSCIEVHVNVDSGMRRLGVEPKDAVDVVRSVQATTGLILSGIWTHFSGAGGLELDLTRGQWSSFLDVLKEFSGVPAPVHAANSSALFAFPDSVNPDIVSAARIGIALYGILDGIRQSEDADLRPVMSMRSRLFQIKRLRAGERVSYGGRWTAPTERLVGTIGAGYADGYPRILGGKSSVTIHGSSYPIVGTVCMDMMMVDLGAPDGPGAGIEPGTDVTLFGNGGPDVRTLATLADTIPYEIVCGISARVPRTYIG